MTVHAVKMSDEGTDKTSLETINREGTLPGAYWRPVMNPETGQMYSIIAICNPKSHDELCFPHSLETRAPLLRAWLFHLGVHGLLPSETALPPLACLVAVGSIWPECVGK